MSFSLIEPPTCIKQLRSGRVVIVPTDTVPGLVSLPEQAEFIYQIKGRDPLKPLILLAAQIEDVRDCIEGWLDEWEVLARRGWPGPLTLVLPVGPGVPFQIHRGGGTIGVRIPAHAQTLSVLRETGPLASTSVNRSGEKALLNTAEIQRQFPRLPLLAGVYGGSGQASTVVRWQDGGWSVLRQGSFRL